MIETQNHPLPTGLGRRASLLLTTLSEQGKVIFTPQDAHRILGGSLSATYKMLHDLARGGWLHPLRKGRYLIIPLEAGPERRYTAHEFLIAHHLAPEGYIAYWTALHHHGLTEQIPRSVWVATPRRRPETIVLGVQYIFVTLRPHKVFGYQPVWIEGRSVPVADLEKSLVDALDHPEHCGGIVGVAQALTVALLERGADLERLTEYALRMRNGAILKRLGYLTGYLALPVGDFSKRWHARLSAGYVRLDPKRPASGPLDHCWRVWVNVPEAELTGWREL